MNDNEKLIYVLFNQENKKKKLQDKKAIEAEYESVADYSGMSRDALVDLAIAGNTENIGTAIDCLAGLSEQVGRLITQVEELKKHTKKSP
ncbi:hypothetical protein ACTQ54_12295 [Fundicoccus sp. Sow4_H7]|uniref:hypothetical protein n=1 Tax=Fundicoccus sp. Sow4_H7 TaxID=3438784 RepID=UPI003F8DBB0A